jgi:glucose-6-phosphate 1-dehydrogenase
LVATPSRPKAKARPSAEATDIARAKEPPTNPLREGVRAERGVADTAMVIFGASGDLTRKKLMPALYNLAIEGLLPADFAVVGVARRPLSREEFRKQMRAAVDHYSRTGKTTDAIWRGFAERLTYVSGNFDDQASFTKLKKELERVDTAFGTVGNRLFY